MEINSSSIKAGIEVVDNSSYKINGAGIYAGETIKASATYDYAFIAGNNIYFSGTCSHDMFIAGNTIDIAKDAHVGRDVFVAGNTVTLNTNVPGSLSVASEKLIIKNVIINGNLETYTGEIVFSGDVTVKGNFKHSNNAIINTENARLTVEGETETYVVDHQNFYYNFEAKLVSQCIWLVCNIIVALIFVSLGKKFFEKMNKFTAKFKAINILSSTGIGLLTIICASIICLLLLISVLGALAGVTLLFAIIIFSIISSTVVSNFIGHKILKKEENYSVDTMLGLLILSVVGLIPYVGGFLVAVASLFGIGIIVKMIKKSNS